MGEIWPWVNQAISEAWGLSPNEVQGITIEFTPHRQPYAIVTVKLNEKVLEVIANLAPTSEWRTP